MIQYNYFKLFQIILNENRGDEGVLSTLSSVLESFRNSSHSDIVQFFKNSMLFGAFCDKSNVFSNVFSNVHKKSNSILWSVQTLLNGPWSRMAISGKTVVILKYIPVSFIN